MQKELNPELFGENTVRVSRSRVAEAPVVAKPPPMSLELENKLNDARIHVHQISEALGRVVSQVNEFIKSVTGKQDRMQQALQKLEIQDQTIASEMNQKFAHLNNRLGERKSLDIKIQEMVDRHNNVLRGYEVRISQMQKLIADKESAMISAQAALNEAKMEISRLKRL